MAFFKIVKRTLVIFLIGIGINWMVLSLHTFHNLADGGMSFMGRAVAAMGNFEYLRILGVMQRLALTYGFAALIAVTVKHKWLPCIIGGGLAGYFLLLVFGNGFDFSEANILSVVDRAVLGASHLYVDNGVRLDPEGLLSVIPSVCHALIGFCCGKAFASAADNRERILKLFITGASLTFAGLLLSYGCPLNKKIWSPAFVLVTCGFAATLLALLGWIIDGKGCKRWSIFFVSFGVNPLFIYMLATALSILLSYLPVTCHNEVMSISSWIYRYCLQPFFGNYPASVLYAILFVGVNWLIAAMLYRKKVYIKI
jgi:predicted acyltransferase